MMPPCIPCACDIPCQKLKDWLATLEKEPKDYEEILRKIPYGIIETHLYHRRLENMDSLTTESLIWRFPKPPKGAFEH
jgi:hypothetical protein